LLRTNRYIVTIQAVKRKAVLEVAGHFEMVKLPFSELVRVPTIKSLSGSKEVLDRHSPFAIGFHQH
jgi:hypothetical protein